MHRSDSEMAAASKSESNLMRESSNSELNPMFASERSLTSGMDRSFASEGSESQDTFAVGADSFNAVALSKPIMAARRRPSQVPNLASLIPAENRLSEKDLIGDEPSSNKRSQEMAWSVPPKGLSATEQWLLDRLLQMERDYSARVEYLEQETQILRNALMEAKITVPPKPTPLVASANSTPNLAIASDKKGIAAIASPSSPVTKKAPPMPANSPTSSLTRRPSSSMESTSSNRNSLTRTNSGGVSGGGAAPLTRTYSGSGPSSPLGQKRIPPAIPSLPSAAMGSPSKPDLSKRESASSNPFEDVTDEPTIPLTGPEPVKSPKETTVPPPVPFEKPQPESEPKAAEPSSQMTSVKQAVDDDEEDVADELKDML